ncbi:MAG: Gfo/Idh/MocA family oxidoreductase [Christensenellaceae bacterium]|nr:Gfo/Idh/MocA family oxidoreductase [Christensenellaceae bacterium]
MAKKTLNVAMIGGGFMGKAHSNAWLKVNKFFDTDFDINLKVIVGNKTPLEAFAARWGYDEVSYDWREVVRRPDIDIVDIGTPTWEHMEMAVAAAEAGKHIVCEKPCALSYQQCLKMAEAAKKAGVVTYLNHNYRRVPAVAYAKQLVEEGRLGTIYHWRGAYLQDWIMDPDFPLTWHLQSKYAGGGPVFDLSSHAYDLARYLIGDAKAVTAVNKTFITERPLPGAGAATFSAGSKTENAQKAPVDVEDASFAVVEFENGALGSIESTRFAVGCKNYNDFEVYGSKGAIRFNFESMNELWFLDATQPQAEQGFRRILCTEGVHPYVSAWWPGGHIIGYEHTFVNAFYDFLQAIAGKGAPITPDFEDGAAIIRFVEAVQLSSKEQRRVLIEEIK